MNRVIEQHFDQVEIRLIASPIIMSYQVLRREITPGEGLTTIPTIFSVIDHIEETAHVS